MLVVDIPLLSSILVKRRYSSKLHDAGPRLLVFLKLIPLNDQRNDGGLFDMYDKNDSRQTYPGWRVTFNRE
jgi:hypothetical protein